MPPTWALSRGRRPGRSSSTGPCRSTRSARPRPSRRPACCRSCDPSTPGLEALPEITLTPRRRARWPAASSCGRRRACPRPADLYRLRDPDGALVAIASRSGRTGSRRTRSSSARRPAVAPGAPDAALMQVVAGVDALAPDLGPIVRRRRRVRRPPSRPPLPAGATRRARRAPAARARRSSPSTTTPTRSSPGGAAAAHRPGGASGTAGRRRRRGHGRPALRRGAAADAYDAFVERIRARARARRAS